MLVPDYIFESSWEVCNKVGGIYTVLSTRAKTLQELFPDHILFIGPDCWGEKPCPYFIEHQSLMADWRSQCAEEGLRVKVGRWDIPGQPIAILVDFQPFFEQKNDIYTRLWEYYGVDSLHAYGDYDEASMFSYAAGRVVESMYKWLEVRGERLENSFKPLSNLSPLTTHNSQLKCIYHANEWMTGLGLLYINKVLPQVATVFTTHATSIGRSIAGNNKPLYDYLFAYNGDQMAGELNMQSKHSIEKQTAWNADCFTTVSDITARECVELLDKPVDVVLPNGFDDSFVPQSATFTRKRRAARRRMIEVANRLMGTHYGDEVIIVSTSGRFEYRNKGIDVFLEAMSRLGRDPQLQKEILAFVMVPGCQMTNLDEGKVKVIFVPYYLTGNDGMLNMTYYDLVLGNDLCIYPSYYEPWGYTPLEAVAFKVPCITTDLAGFGLWAKNEGIDDIEEGVKVIHRTDYNFDEVAEAIKDTVTHFASLDETTVKKARQQASKLSKKALWKSFIRQYEKAYDLALHKAELRGRG